MSRALIVRLIDTSFCLNSMTCNLRPCALRTCHKLWFYCDSAHVSSVKIHINNEESSLILSQALRRGYKQNTRSNDWMSHRKPLIFTQESFSSPFEMFYNSVGRSPPIPRRLRQSRRYIWFIHTTRNTWSVFRLYSVFWCVGNRQLLSLCGAKKFYVGFHTTRLCSKSDGGENTIDVRKH